MKKIFIILFLSLFLAGCFHRSLLERKPPAPPSVPPTPAQKETPLLNTSQPPIDENDYLDEALNELEAVE